MGNESLRIVEYLLGDAFVLKEQLCLKVRFAEVGIQRLVLIHLSGIKVTSCESVVIYNANPK